MKTHRLVSMLAIPALVVACRTAGPPLKPLVRLVTPPPCLLEPPAGPGPILRSAPRCEVVDEQERCPPLTAQQDAALWQYIDHLEGYAARAWSQCGPRPKRRGGSAASDDGSSQGATP